MPWKEANDMNVKTKLVLRVFEAKVPFNDLCKEFWISRKNGYKCKERFLEQGLEGLSDQSRRPVSSPQQLGENSVCKIVKLKLAHPSWGPRKIPMVFARSFPECELPSDSTFKRVLDNAELVKRSTRRPSTQTGRLLGSDIMTSKQRRDMSASVRARLMDVAKLDNESFDLVLMRFAI
jgi:putative transposase